MVQFLPTTVLIAALAVAVSAASYETPLCGSCGSYKPPCVSGTTCKDGLCKKLDVGAGLFCDDKCSVCTAGLKCDGGKCVAPPPPPPPPSPCGGPCVAKGSSCETGLTCTTGVCKKLKVKVGESCANSCESCDDSLKCDGGKCVVPPPPPSPCGGPCVAKGSSCETGLTCKDGLCKKLMVDVNGSCAKSCESCKGDLKCDGSKCVAPPPPVAKCGETCSRTIKCESGARCYKSKCTKFVGFGQTCDDTCYKCSSYLKCNSYSHKCSYGY
jgi:hypothetical protein